MKSLQAPGNLKIEYVPIGKLKPLAKNARAHPPEQIEAMVKAIQRFGFYAPLLVDGKKGAILKGNGSFQAALQIGMRSVPVIYTQGLTPAELRALVIWDNKSAEKSGWDRDILAAELTDLKGMGFDLELTGFSLGEIEDFLKPPPSRDDEPPTPALPKHAVSKLGDVWCLGEHRLACGDATKPDHMKALMAGERAQCVFTDPPYGISYEAPSGSFETIKGDDLRRGQLADLLHRAFATALPHTRDDAGWYVWHASATREEFAKALRDVGIVELGTIIWAKPGMVLGWSDYRWAHEPCLYACRQGVKPAWHGDRTQTTVWRVATINAARQHTAIGTGIVLTTKEGDELYVSALAPKGRKVRHVHVEAAPIALSASGGPDEDLWEVARDNGHGKASETFHPTQKPVELARRAIRNSTAEGDVVLDLFAGSASTIMGAEHTKRRGYALELDPRYVDVGVRRWQDATGKAAVHERSRKTFEATQAQRLGKKGAAS